MKPHSTDHEAIERLSAQFRTLMQLQQIEDSTCLLNPSQSCATSFECSSTRIVLCSTPLVALEVRCARLSPYLRDMLWDWKSMPTFAEQANKALKSARALRRGK